MTSSHFLGGAAVACGHYEQAHAHYDAARAQNERLDLRIPTLLGRKARALPWLAEGNNAQGRGALQQLSRDFQVSGLLGLYNDMPAAFRAGGEGHSGRWGSSPPEQPSGAL